MIGSERKRDALFIVASAFLLRRRSTTSSPSRRLEAIIRGVQPDASCGASAIAAFNDVQYSERSTNLNIGIKVFP